MRYDDWDVILFPKESHVPIQEFKTACYVAPDKCEWRSHVDDDFSPMSMRVQLTSSFLQTDDNYLS